MSNKYEDWCDYIHEQVASQGGRGVMLIVIDEPDAGGGSDHHVAISITGDTSTLPTVLRMAADRIETQNKVDAVLQVMRRPRGDAA
jgi:hypothetical protein